MSGQSEAGDRARTYAVVSGKGGTGKTTVSALFALLATECADLVVADCDVEASNLPLALGADVSSAQPFEGGAVARIDPRTCMGCGACADACRYGAIIPPDLDGPDVPTLAYCVDELACEGCGACTLVACPNAAVTLLPTRVGEVLEGAGPSGPVIWGRLEPGMDLSGRLVTEVREAARRRAVDGFVLVDGPPGVGCPFLSAIAGVDGLIAVTEPSVSGAHDLERLLQVAARFDIPVDVIINKADLSEPGRDLLRTICAERGTDVVADIPFDETLAVLPQRLAETRGRADVRDLAQASPGVAAIVDAWDALALCKAAD